MYLTASLAELSFQRLSSRKAFGKTPLERTSALMYFLAFDATVKKQGPAPLDFSPQSLSGKNHRDSMALEFARLVKLHNGKNGRIRQVSILGKIEVGGRSAEKRISSNFFTVPLKKASGSSKPYLYPNRPAPLIKMGNAATGMLWGMDYCEEWKKNLPKLLADTKSNTPFTDLAVFVFRDAQFDDRRCTLKDSLEDGVSGRFSEPLASFWAKQMEAEKVFLKHVNSPFQKEAPTLFNDQRPDEAAAGSSKDLMIALDKDVLINRILYLEGLLNAREIEYQPISN